MFNKSILSFVICLLSAEIFAQELEKKSLSVVSIKSQDLAKAPKQIYINNFKIFYQMIAEAEKTVYGGRQFGGGSYTGNATAKLAVGVEGVSPEDLQSLTDQIFNDYVASLEAKGFQVTSAKDGTKVPFYAEHQKLDGPRVNQEQVPGSLMVIPSGFSYFVKRVNKKGKEKSGGLMAAVTSVNGGSANDFISALYHKGVPKISKEMGDAIVVDVAINVPSIDLDPKSKLGTAKIKGGPALRVQTARATYASGKSKKPGAATPEAAVEILLNKPIAIGGVFESEQFKAVATKSRTSVPSYARFFTVDNKTVELTNTINCDAVTYKERVAAGVNLFLNTSLEKFSMGLSGEKAK